MTQAERHDATMRAFHCSSEDMRREAAAHLTAFDSDHNMHHLILADCLRMQAEAVEMFERVAA